jgi:3-oxoacyl-(acyl-carrier-protein) synthase
MTRPVYLAGGELLSCHGGGIAAAASACLAQIAAPGRVTAPYMAGELTLPYYRLRDGQTSVRETLRKLGESALHSAGVGTDARRRTALLLGSSSLDVNLHEQQYLEARGKDPDAIPLRNPDQGFVAECLATDLGLQGPRYTLLTACSASANALLYAAWMIRREIVDEALVVGTELFNLTSLLGFHGMLLLSKSGTCRPFDVRRDGIVLGEAVAVAVLSNKPGRARWRIAGGATLCDTAQPTNSVPGKIAEVIAKALLDSGYSAQDIACVKAHGTATGANDLSEAAGIRAVFPRGVPPMTSIKPVLGHTLGACGVVETLTMLECLERGVIPAAANYAEADPELPLQPLTRNQPYRGGPVLLNYFGFGGNNCALVIAPLDGVDA